MSHNYDYTYRRGNTWVDRFGLGTSVAEHNKWFAASCLEPRRAREEAVRPGASRGAGTAEAGPRRGAVRDTEGHLRQIDSFRGEGHRTAVLVPYCYRAAAPRSTCAHRHVD